MPALRDEDRANVIPESANRLVLSVSLKKFCPMQDGYDNGETLLDEVRDGSSC